MRSDPLKYISVVLTILALVFLFLGIYLPCIRVTSHLLNVIPVGTEERSILGLIGNLFKSNILLGLLILLFSILIPVTKLVLAATILIWEGKITHPFIHFLVHNIGKWSMVDVFTTAIVVTMLTFNNFRVKVFSTEGHLLAGFYFFLAYGILTIFTTYFIQKKSSATG